MRPLTNLLLLQLGAPYVLADFLGPRYVAPTDLTSSDSLITRSWKNLTSTLDSLLAKNDNELPENMQQLSNITFSLGIFSIHDAAAAETYTYHHTAQEIAQAEHGTNKVDADSIYRIASITKVFTVLAGLLEFKRDEWDRPVTDFIPELAIFSSQNPGDEDPVMTTQWDKITLGALAAHMAGVPTNTALLDSDLLLQWLAAGSPEDENPVLLGLPPLEINSTNFPTCQQDEETQCNASTYAEAVAGRQPVFTPWSSPHYANNGFIILGLAMSRITGRPWEDVFKSGIFGPLGMESSTALTPSAPYKDVVIPGGLVAAGVTPTPDFFSATGAILSTINDLAKFGVGILNSTLLPDDQTRKWMKPVTHTGHLEYSVGRPWEINRYIHASSGVISDMYTKSGDAGLFSSFLVLLPEYDAGFSILTAGTRPERSFLAAIVADLVTDSIMPALEAQAAVESQANLAGTYTSSDGNSTVTLTIDPSGNIPGLNITSWMMNGTDFLALSPQTIRPGQPRLLPTIAKVGDSQLAFRVAPLPSKEEADAAAGPFYKQYSANIDWLSAGGPLYGAIGINLFIFDVDGDGKATSVTAEGFRVTMDKE